MEMGIHLTSYDGKGVKKKVHPSLKYMIGVCMPYNIEKAESLANKAIEQGIPCLLLLAEDEKEGLMKTTEFQNLPLCGVDLRFSDEQLTSSTEAIAKRAGRLRDVYEQTEHDFLSLRHRLHDNHEFLNSMLLKSVKG
jgi:hypothetical protein